jgi:uncharacterized protein (DUF302 family)
MNGPAFLIDESALEWHIADMTPPGIVTLRSPHSFDDTVQRLLATFSSHQIKVFATIDQQAEALAVGLTMPPTTLIIFGSPKAGTPLMLAQPPSALDLPLKVLVSESTLGEVTVSFNDPQYILARHSLPAEFLKNLAPAAHLIQSALA